MTPFTIGPLQEEWLTYLETYPEQQHEGSLGFIRNGEIKACCLGAAGLISGVVCPTEDGMLETFNSQVGGLSECYEAIGLYGEFGNTHDDTDYFRKLSVLNDHGTTWPEIAALIRSKPQDYFKISV